MSRNFTHLHVHTDYSVLDGLGKVDAYVKRAAELGMSHLSITDHGTVCGAPEFYWSARKAGIQPILGSEFYFVPDADKVKEEKSGERFHITILALNEDGYRTIVELSTEAHRRYYYKPVLDRALLESLGDAAENLVCLSGCAGSILSRKIMGGIKGKPSKELEWWRRIFLHFYTEIMDHGIDDDVTLNRGLIKLSKRFKVPWVITNDPHYVMEGQEHDHDALLAIQTASDIDDPNRFRFNGTGYHLKSRKEMRAAFSRYPSGVWKTGAANTLEISRLCSLKIAAWESRSWHIPNFPDVNDAYKELKRLAIQGLKSRGLEDDERYKKQMKHELREFKRVGMEHFLLITRDVCEYARTQKIRVGPGRGSVAGTLVGYLAGIHKVDPIRYNLLFERFLNPERPKMPDVDTDFAQGGRPVIFEYVEEKYGKENIARVAAFQTMKTKRAFGALAKAHGISDFTERQKLSKKIEEDDEGNAVLPEEIRASYPDLAEQLDQFSGTKSSVGSHPAGVLILSENDPIRELIPEMWVPSSKHFVSQVDLDAAAEMGLMKSDFLGLRTLETIDQCLKLVEKRHGIEVEPDDWIPDEGPDDAELYKQLGKGETVGIFQMEGSTNHRGIQTIQPTRFEDIVACTSLYRAGPIMAGAPKRYLKNKKDGKIRVPFKGMKEILKDSWGEMIYQEQMFEILHRLAGFSWARVDDAKTAMTKKDAEKMAALEEDAMKGFQEVGGMNKAQAESVWKMIKAQATYLFNRSHAVAYSILTYQTLRLRHEYPLEYLTALLRTVPPSKENLEKRGTYLSELVVRGFKILLPDANRSGIYATATPRGAFRFGLVDIKGIGVSQATKIVNGRGKGFVDLNAVASAANNKGVMEALTEAGALKSLGVEPNYELVEARLGWQFKDRMRKWRKKHEDKIKKPSTNGSTVRLIGEITKIEARKTRVEKRPFRTWKIRWSPGEEYSVTIWEDANDLWDLQVGSIVAVKGRWQSEWQNVGVSDPEQVRVLETV